MTRNWIYISLLSFGLFGCGNQAASSGDEAAAAEEPVIHFGVVITPDNAVSFETLLGLMKEAETVNLKVRGKVTTVCQTKGCWMEVGSTNPEVTETMFVQFEDYGFFVPKDLSGSEVVMAGQATWETTSVEDQRHYAEDEGLSKEQIAAITEPKHELKFMATGVVIVQ
ncbi:MAG: DUF4920 domain-containing protein [Saprospiraceae bacterium]|nr:DUF4920 domain-containing protein [Saprospiraceae bacterium]